MRIEIQAPYNEKYSHGYTRINEEKRNKLYLVKHGETSPGSSTAYARYLMSVSLGRWLTANENVDHKDEDPTNDAIDNLQLLTRSENSIKHCLLNPGEMMTLICPECNLEFTKRAHQLKYKLKQGKQPCCSRTCGGKHSHKKDG